MPVYEYLCEKCENVTEALRRISDADEAIVCEHCGSKKTHRTHSVFAAGASQSESIPMPGPCGTCGAAQSCGMAP